MSFRTVVIENSAKLDYSMGFLVVRQEKITRIHLSDISMLMIASTAVSLTSSLLAALTKAKIKVIFCDEKRQPSSELVSYYGCHDCSGKIRTQITWAKSVKDEVWTEIVYQKILKQMEHLLEYNRSQAILLKDYLSELTVGDETNREGHAARVYFAALFGDNFSRSQENSINASLNYGYGILLSMVNREIVANGYLTQLGIFHDSADNPFNLGSDLMEPFRVLVDRMVKQYMPQQFESSDKHRMLELVNTEVCIDGRNEYVPNAIKIYVRSVFDAINDGDVSKIKFYQINEL
ncbi:MAG: type II CRISPR-associated endonuclease Cas1 [Lachnospiraceae bacterium]|nr:type II CRISPR-associated endonuclease Cas1 [Lachnospiraceae bacterium]